MSENTCKFPNCPRHPESNGFCIGHAGYGSSIASVKKVNRIAPKSAKRLAAEKSAKEQRADGETELQEWFTRIMKAEKPVCWETGQSIDTRKSANDPDGKPVKNFVNEFHGSIAHILPKKIFKSIKTHPKNYLILKMWGGIHARYDLSWDSASKMKVWPVAVKRFIEMYDDIADSEKKYLPDVLLKELEKVRQ